MSLLANILLKFVKCIEEKQEKIPKSYGQKRLRTTLKIFEFVFSFFFAKGTM